MGNFTIPRTEFYRQTMRQQESGTTREMMAQHKPTAAAGPESLQRLKIPVATTTVIFTY
jgi:hypothetical protein